MNALDGYYIAFLLIRATSYGVGILALWGLVDPQRFFCQPDLCSDRAFYGGRPLCHINGDAKPLNGSSCLFCATWGRPPAF